MSFLKNLMDAVLSQQQGTTPSSGQKTILESVLGMVGGGGLNNLLEGFRQKGLGEAVQSWIGTGSNVPVSGEEVQASLGDEKIQEIAQKAGLSKSETAGWLAQLLPQVVDKLTPEGKLPDTTGLANMLQSFMGTLGGRKP